MAYHDLSLPGRKGLEIAMRARESWPEGFVLTEELVGIYYAYVHRCEFPDPRQGTIYPQTFATYLLSYAIDTYEALLVLLPFGVFTATGTLLRSLFEASFSLAALRSDSSIMPDLYAASLDQVRLALRGAEFLESTCQNISDFRPTGRHHCSACQALDEGKQEWAQRKEGRDPKNWHAMGLERIAQIGRRTKLYESFYRTFCLCSHPSAHQIEKNITDDGAGQKVLKAGIDEAAIPSQLSNASVCLIDCLLDHNFYMKQLDESELVRLGEMKAEFNVLPRKGKT